MLYPQRDINRMLAHIRNMSLGDFSKNDVVNQLSIMDELINVNISAIIIEESSFAHGRSLYDIDLRKNTGVTVLAVRRKKEIIEHPDPETSLLANDIVYVLGNPEQINAATELFSKDITGI